LVLLAAALGAAPPPERAKSDPAVTRTDVLGVRPNRPMSLGETAAGKPAEPSKTAARPAPPNPAPVAAAAPLIDPQQAWRSVSTVAVFALASLAPAAVLMATAFVRINVVLLLLRQALGSPQVPGNQVLTVLSLLLTALVMRPTGEAVYTRAIEPYSAGRVTWQEAYRAGSAPVKAFMVEQIERTRHENYLWALYDEAVPPAPGRVEPVYGDEFPMRVVAPAFLLSELTTALVIGFYLYLPFLVVDLVVSAVLASAGLFMLPPSLVALPLKLILFVAADGWLHVAALLLRSFGPAAGASP
jgi:flagellar biosynthetic protein FliP